MTLRGLDGEPNMLRPQYHEKAGDRGSVPKDHQQKTAYGDSNGHMTTDR